jgi:hypothetical protein
MAERTGCPILLSLWSYVVGNFLLRNLLDQKFQKIKDLLDEILIATFQEPTHLILPKYGSTKARSHPLFISRRVQSLAS